MELNYYHTTPSPKQKIWRGINPRGDDSFSASDFFWASQNMWLKTCGYFSGENYPGETSCGFKQTTNEMVVVNLWTGLS